MASSIVLSAWVAIMPLLNSSPCLFRSMLMRRRRLEVGRAQGTLLHAMPCKHHAPDIYIPMLPVLPVCIVDALISGVPDDDARLDAPATCLSDIENIEAAMVKLLESVEVVESYVQRVSSGEIQGDAELAAAIHTALASLPHLDASTFSTIFATHIQDLLAIVYLANMTKNQLAIADKASVLS